MKKRILYSLLIVLSYGIIYSCSKDNSSSDNNNIVIYKIPVSVTAQYIAYAFCNNAAGINLHLERAASYTTHGRTDFDSSFVMSKKDSYQYQVIYNFSRPATIPPKALFDYSAAGTFNGGALTSQDTQYGNGWSITTLDQAQLTVNGNGTDGGQQYSYLEKALFSSQIHYSFVNLKMDTTTFMVTSGSATISINGSGPGGVHFDYPGTLTFMGNRTATLVLAGSTFDISLLTGTMTKK